jgi:signal transduction histidine kinase
VPVVVLTGLVDEGLARRAMNAGAQDYLIKNEITPALVARAIYYAIERKRAERHAIAAQAARRAQLLADVSDVLGSSLELPMVAERFTHALVPVLADVAILDVTTAPGMADRVAIAAEPAELHARLDDARRFPVAAARPSPAWRALTTRRPVLMREVEPQDVRALLGDAYEENGGPLAAHSLVAVPLVLRDELLGVLTLLLVEGGRKYDYDDVLLAAELARRAALSVENSQLYREAQRAIKARDEVVAIVSHDLRNPLNVIGLTTKLLEEELAGNPACLDLLARAERAAASMKRLLNDLLDVTRLDQGTLRLERRRIDLNALVEEIVETQRPLAAQKQQRIDVSTDVDEVFVDVDRDRIVQVMANLIGNGVKFTPRGGALEVRVRLGTKRVTVAISDTGPGIDPATLPHVFERFYQAKTTKDGVGLGLAIAKGLVEAHGGSIAVTSVPGTGTTFWFELPVASVGAGVRGGGGGVRSEEAEAVGV